MRTRAYCVEHRVCSRPAFRPNGFWSKAHTRSNGSGQLPRASRMVIYLAAFCNGMQWNASMICSTALSAGSAGSPIAVNVHNMHFVCTSYAPHMPERLSLMEELESFWDRVPLVVGQWLFREPFNPSACSCVSSFDQPNQFRINNRISSKSKWSMRPSSRRANGST